MEMDGAHHKSRQIIRLQIASHCSREEKHESKAKETPGVDASWQNWSAALILSNLAILRRKAAHMKLSNQNVTREFERASERASEDNLHELNKPMLLLMSWMKRLFFQICALLKLLWLKSFFESGPAEVECSNKRRDRGLRKWRMNVFALCIYYCILYTQDYELSERTNIPVWAHWLSLTNDITLRLSVDVNKCPEAKSLTAIVLSKESLVLLLLFAIFILLYTRITVSFQNHSCKFVSRLPLFLCPFPKFVGGFCHSIIPLPFFDWVMRNAHSMLSARLNCWDVALFCFYYLPLLTF